MTVSQSASQEISRQKLGRVDLLAVLVTVTKSTIQENCWQKLGIGINILVVLVTVFLSASQKIFWQKLGRGRFAGSFSDWHQICQSGILLTEMGEM